MSFVIQQKAILHHIWYEPNRSSLFAGRTRSDSVHELRAVLEMNADTTTLSFRQHFRIVTDDGAPVARFVIRPGRFKQIRRRY